MDCNKESLGWLGPVGERSRISGWDGKQLGREEMWDQNGGRTDWEEEPKRLLDGEESRTERVMGRREKMDRRK